ncbi:MAG: hypothetical protein ACR2HJ_08155 [Fimbriimonadales bacterium]
MKISRMMAAGLLIACGVSASAHRRYFAYTYDWFTPSMNEKELELYWTQKEGGDATAQIEFEYGITDRWMVAPYAIFSHTDGEVDFEGWKLETRYRFGDFAYDTLMPGIYFEVKKVEGEDATAEAKLITTLMTQSGLIWSANLVAETALDGDEKVEWAYVTGIAQRMSERLHLGFEFKGHLVEDGHSAGPSFAYSLSPNQKLFGTALFSYPGGGKHEFRVLFEHEF